MGWVQEEMTRIRTIKEQAQICYEHQISHASMAYGQLFNVMLQVEGSAEQVLRKVARDGIPKRLKHPFIDKTSDFIKSGGDNARGKHE
jgi:phage replication initiation protein